MILEYFTKFAQACPYRRCDAEETCEILLENWIHLYGAPLAIQSEKGSQFTAELTTEMMKHVDILQIPSSPYHPQTNGLVERQNRNLILMLRRMCSGRQDDWDLYVGRVMCAYNSTRHSTTGFSPFMLWHGRKKRLPLMFLFPKREKGLPNCKEYPQNTFRRSAKSSSSPGSTPSKPRFVKSETTIKMVSICILSNRETRS